MSPDFRPSFPITIVLLWLCFKTAAAALPRFNAISGVIGCWLATPRTPSVPKNLPISQSVFSGYKAFYSSSQMN
jgi:hypothetical protein